MLCLFTRAVLILALLFGFLFAILMAFGYYFEWSTLTIIIITLLIVSAQFFLGPYIIQFIYKIKWISLDDLPQINRDFIINSCQKKRLKIPKLGIIDDGNPNAFTFGNFPSNARLVLTRGLIEKLTGEEVNSVIAHELGHIAHWDFVVMTLASVVPLVFYIIYIGTVRSRSGDRRSRGGAVIVGLISYIFYIITQYIVLLLSRIREYYADEYSAKLTENPDLLSASLVKIAYGLSESRGKSEKDISMSSRFNATKSLGIFDIANAKVLALASARVGGFTIENMMNAMKWDLWNPWATVYELNSTHPLPAKRIRRLEGIMHKMGKPSAFDFKLQKPESFFDEFIADIFIKYMPVFSFLLVFILLLIFIPIYYYVEPLTLIGASLGGAIAIASVFSFLKTLFKYPSKKFPERKVASLLGEVKVSAIRPIPATVKVRIIGRGIPGLFWSEDMVLQDDTGFIVIDYRQPLNILNFLFGIFIAEKMIGKEAIAEGWYRRSPLPHLEMFRITTDDKVRKGYIRIVRIFFAIAGVIIGLGILGYIFV
ncbi:MAG: M48 family metalloprotease [bacterium]